MKWQDKQVILQEFWEQMCVCVAICKDKNPMLNRVVKTKTKFLS